MRRFFAWYDRTRTSKFYSLARLKIALTYKQNPRGKSWSATGSGASLRCHRLHNCKPVDWATSRDQKTRRMRIGCYTIATRI